MTKSINKDDFLAYQEECFKNAHSSDTSKRSVISQKYKYYYYKTNYEATVMELIRDGYAVTQIHGYLKSKGIIISLKTLYKYVKLSISSPPSPETVSSSAPSTAVPGKTSSSLPVSQETPTPAADENAQEDLSTFVAPPPPPGSNPEWVWGYGCTYEQAEELARRITKYEDLPPRPVHFSDSESIKSFSDRHNNWINLEERLKKQKEKDDKEWWKRTT